MESLNNRMNDTEERISELKDNQFNNTQLVRHMGENRIKTKKSTQEMNDTIKKSNIRVTGTPAGMEEEAFLYGYSIKLIQYLSKLKKRTYQTLG